MRYTPLLTATAIGAADEVIAIVTNASLTRKGSYLPRLGFEAAMVAGGLIAARSGMVNRNAATAASVAGAALLGNNLAAGGGRVL